MLEGPSKPVACISFVGSVKRIGEVQAVLASLKAVSG